MSKNIEKKKSGRLGMVLFGTLMLFGIVSFCYFIVPDFLRRRSQETLREGPGDTLVANVLALSETGHWYAKKPILRFVLSVRTEDSKERTLTVEQEVPLLQMSQMRVGSKVHVKIDPQDLNKAVIMDLSF